MKKSAERLINDVLRLFWKAGWEDDLKGLIVSSELKSALGIKGKSKADLLARLGEKETADSLGEYRTLEIREE